MNQAASDYGVQIGTHRFKTAVTGRGEIGLERSLFIREACQSTKNIDGLIVSLPLDNMVDALSICEIRGIPVVAINAIPTTTTTNEIEYVGQDDYQSGYEAGKRLLEAGTTKGWCLVHANLTTLKERCRGMESAFLESDSTAEFMGIVFVPDDDADEYKNTLQTTLGSQSKNDWSKYGVLSTGQIQIPLLMGVLSDHPELKAGTFDMDFDTDDDDDNSSNALLFYIDQQPYSQGYVAMSIIIMKILSAPSSFEDVSSSIGARSFRTGPKFVVPRVSNDDSGTDTSLLEERNQRECHENTNYTVCKPKPPLRWSGKFTELGRLCEECEGMLDIDDDVVFGAFNNGEISQLIYHFLCRRLR